MYKLLADELASFEISWAANGRGTLPSWNDVHVDLPYRGDLLLTSI